MYSRPPACSAADEWCSLAAYTSPGSTSLVIALARTCRFDPIASSVLGKAFAENLGRLYADKHEVEVVCLRIGTLAERPTTPRHLSTWLSPRDAVELFDCSLAAADVGFTVAYGASANQRSWWNLDSAKRLGYHPSDDAEEWVSEVEAVSVDPTESGEGPQGGKYAE